jgi:putative ABC transport system permease protein
MPLLISTAIWLYRLALVRYSPEFRAAWGGEMVDAFELSLRDAWSKGGGSAVARVCWNTMSDLAKPLPSLRVGKAPAMRRARTTLGGRGVGMFEDFLMDVRLAVRGLFRAPGQAGVLILTLGLGLGTTTAIFSVLQGVLLSPLPYDEPEELISIRHRSDVDGLGLSGLGGADILDYQEGAPSIEAFGAVQTLESNLNDDQGAARIKMGWSTRDFWQMLGTEAAMGRVLESSDWAGADRAKMEDPNFVPPPMAVLLGHDLWVSRFGSDSDVLGRSIRVNGQSMNVIGVLPAGFKLHFPAGSNVTSDIDVFALMPVPLSNMGRGGSGLQTIARLKDGATIEQAEGELKRVLDGLRESEPVHARRGTEVVVSPLHDEVVRPARAFLWILFGAVGLLLLIACTNVANLLLVRASARETEFAVRSALGVGRGRMVRQLLTEGLVLSVLGSATGLLLAGWAVRGLIALRPGNLPRLGSVSLDHNVLFFSLALTVGVSLLFGLIPALASGGGNPRALVSSRGSGSARAGTVTRNLLIVGEVAFSVILVVGAGLLLRSFSELRQVDLGFEAEGLLAVDVALPFFGYRADESRSAFYVQLAERAASLPGVTGAGVTPAVPLGAKSNGTWLTGISPNGEALDDADAPQARFRALSAGTLGVLGANFVDGRDLILADETSEGPVPVVIDRRLADAHWPEGALGRSFQGGIAGYTGQGSIQELRVVGVVEPVRFESASAVGEPTVFLPYRAYAPVDGTLIVETQASPAQVLAGVREIVQSLDPGVPAYSVRRVSDIVEDSMAESRYALLLVGVFAVTALLLAAVGLYGVISTLVQQRTREIGIRMAHGARAGDIRRMVLKDGGQVVVVGVLVGLGGSVLMAPLVNSLLFGVDPVDPATLLVTALLLGMVAILASTLPAQRAARVDPVEALREG